MKYSLIPVDRRGAQTPFCGCRCLAWPRAHFYCGRRSRYSCMSYYHHHFFFEAYGEEPGRTLRILWDQPASSRPTGEVRRHPLSNAASQVPLLLPFLLPLPPGPAARNRERSAKTLHLICGGKVGDSAEPQWRVLAIASFRGGSYEESAVGPATLPVRVGLSSNPLAPLWLQQASQRPSSG